MQPGVDDRGHEPDLGRKPDRGQTHGQTHGHGHGHVVTVQAGGAGALAIALALILAFMIVEVVVGWVAHSLVLLSDAGHMLTDAASIALALVAARLAARPARGNLTFGLKRVEILSAQANGITLLLLAVWFVYQAVRRLIDPPQVSGSLVLVTALAGVVVNLAASWLIARADRRSLNVRGAFLHIVTDLLAFVATAVAGLVVLTTGWLRADAVAALVVAGLMLAAGWALIAASWRVFLEAAPRGVDVAAIDADLHAVPGVVDVHDLHVWEVTSGFPVLSAHVLVDHGQDCHERREAISALLLQRYGLDHSTLQVDHPASLVVPAEDLRRRVDGSHPPH